MFQLQRALCHFDYNISQSKKKRKHLVHFYFERDAGGKKKKTSLIKTGILTDKPLMQIFNPFLCLISVTFSP